MKIIQFFMYGTQPAAEFEINGIKDNGIVCNENGNNYVCTGSDFYKNLTKHYFTDSLNRELNEFLRKFQS